MLKEIKSKKFANGVVYLLETEDGYPLEVTDTFLPFYTKDAIGKHQNFLENGNLGSRKERWMIGVSTMSGCPVGCKFCATSKLNRCRSLTWQEIADQVWYIYSKNITTCDLTKTKEFKINYTRMGSPFLNIENVKKAIEVIDTMFPQITVHHYISTIGVKGADYSWIKDNITLQFSVHSFKEEYRDWLIPYKHKISLEEMGKVRTKSNLKTTLNLTLVRPEDFDIEKLKQWFDPKYFFIKLSPINTNEASEENSMGTGTISQHNIV
jgi:23S rRNA (adenine2503-C2)-methyltransferase